jgi:hypothetical protein
VPVTEHRGSSCESLFSPGYLNLHIHKHVPATERLSFVVNVLLLIGRLPETIQMPLCHF